jgi:lambda repressor-like predicted transcriptional regulator
LTSYLSNLEKNRREKLEIIGSLKKEDMSFNKASVFKDISQSSLHNNLQARDTRKIAQ